MVVSLDTEEDNWYRSRSDLTAHNIGELPRLTALFERLGVRPTYFTTYHVASDPRAVALLREANTRTHGEIGAHLHPWNTPPLTEPFTARNSMLKNLPADLQLAKLAALTTALEQAFGARPRSFRAGRYGFGRDTVGALLRCGYEVDSSVTPFVSWEQFDDGPTFVDAPLTVYRLAPGRDVSKPDANGALIEVPLSRGFRRRPFSVWGHLHRALDKPGLRSLRRICQRTALSPELSSVAEMLTLSRHLLDLGVQHLHLSFHTPSLMPGLSPFAPTAADVTRIYASVEEYLARLARLASLRFVTVHEAAALLANRGLPEAAAC